MAVRTVQEEHDRGALGACFAVEQTKPVDLGAAVENWHGAHRIRNRNRVGCSVDVFEKFPCSVDDEKNDGYDILEPYILATN